jgi:hypothetical protein
MLEIDDNRAAYDERHPPAAARRQDDQALWGAGHQDANDTTDGVPKECPSTGIPRKCGRCELVTT